MRTTTVFFRDDDAADLTAPLRTVVDLLLEERIPCNYQVVPTHLSAKAADWMRARRSDHPALVQLNQHGYCHSHEIDGQLTHAEFSGRRSYEDQYDVLARGREILERMLDEDFGGDIFTPPCHKYDQNTLRALDALGFRVLSAGIKGSLAARVCYGIGRTFRRSSVLGRGISYHCSRIPFTSLTEVSGAIDVDEQQDGSGNKILKSGDDLFREFRWRMRQRPRVLGVMLHHANYVDDDKVDALRSFIAALKREPNVRFESIDAIAARLAS